MIKVYGYSDDTVICEGAESEYEEIPCFDSEVEIYFKDGTRINVRYPKCVDGKKIGVWQIKFLNHGDMINEFCECFDEDAEVYSDVLEINSSIVDVFVRGWRRF